MLQKAGHPIYLGVDYKQITTHRSSRDDVIHAGKMWVENNRGMALLNTDAPLHAEGRLTRVIEDIWVSNLIFITKCMTAILRNITHLQKRRQSCGLVCEHHVQAKR